jgi:hypothetical protein
MLEMRADRIDVYWDAMIAIESQEILISCKLQDFPHLKPNERKKWHRQVYQTAYPHTRRAPVTNEELANRLRHLNG